MAAKLQTRDAEAEFLLRTEKYAGSDTARAGDGSGAARAEEGPDEAITDVAAHNRRLLGKLASKDVMDERERIMHERFLRAKAAADAANKTAAVPGTASRAATTAGSTPSVAQQQRSPPPPPSSPQPLPQGQQDERQPKDSGRGAEGRGGQVAGHRPKAAPCSKDQLREWGYPEVDRKFLDREWHKQQLELDSTDPRHNPNLARGQDHPEFWNHITRKPVSKTIMSTQAHWNSRRQVWVDQYDRVEQMNVKRELISARLEDCSPDIKRTLAPIMKYSYTMNLLADMLDWASQEKKTFNKFIEERAQRELLQNIRAKIDAGGEQAAEAMMVEYDTRRRAVEDALREEKLALERSGKERVTADAETLSGAMNLGEKCKKDGLIEWEQGNWDEARKSWKQGDEALRRYKARDFDPANKAIFDLHGALLRNLAQACIKLEMWTDALTAANSAIGIDPEDHKAWFRKTCALEGLGKLDLAEECLAKIDDCSVGRPDRTRILKDIQARREKFAAIREREDLSGKKMLGKALQKGVFSIEREQEAVEDRSEEAAVPVKHQRLDPLRLLTRKQLTRDGAEDILIDLRDAYRDPTFQKQITKLAQDVRGEKREFLANLKKVALPVQKPVLERWGFPPSEQGVLEMMRAVQDFARGKAADPAVQRRADDATRSLYGCMYDVITWAGPEHEAPLPSYGKPGAAGGVPGEDSGDESGQG